MKDNQLSKLKKRHWLKESIKEKGFTYQQVGDAMGVSTMTVYNYVKGHTIPTPNCVCYQIRWGVPCRQLIWGVGGAV